MNSTIMIIAMICMLLTLLICFAGIFVMASGEEKAQKYGNKLMVMRVSMQALSIILIALAFV